MAFPLFFTTDLSIPTFTLDEDTSKHMIGVLRMAKGEGILLTDGNGTKAQAVIVDDNRKRCAVRIQRTEKQNPQTPHITVAISIIKNASRFEWFLEKATEIGVNEIVPLLCERTEKEKFRYDRMKGILISAMLQSQQTWLPLLHGPTPFDTLVKNATQPTKFIAHCLPEKKVQLAEALAVNTPISRYPDILVCIGPEGDFTEKEISLALENSFTAVALGNTRLRTETAGMAAAALLRIPYASA